MKKYKCIVANDKWNEKFVHFPSTVYKDDINPRNKKEEIQLLTGTHPLSGDMTIYPLIVLDDKNDIIARCILTCYDGDDTAYVGLFDAFCNQEATNVLLNFAAQKAQETGKKRLLGPIDASIYIGYRFKIDRFDKTYTGEPYNKPYYAELWKNAGFNITDKYISNQLRRVSENDLDKRLEKIHAHYIERGYEFQNIDLHNFQLQLDGIYELMMDLYSNFSGYKKISKKQFFTLFNPLQQLINPEMAKVVYKDGQLKAFCISLPNYGGLTHGHIKPTDLLKIHQVKQNPTEYIVLYAGSKIPGLGGALVHEIREELLKNQCTSIGALIKEGNITGRMYQDLYIDQFQYVLLSKEIS